MLVTVTLRRRNHSEPNTDPVTPPSRPEKKICLLDMSTSEEKFKVEVAQKRILGGGGGLMQMKIFYTPDSVPQMSRSQTDQILIPLISPLALDPDRGSATTGLDSVGSQAHPHSPSAPKQVTPSSLAFQVQHCVV